MKILVVDDDPAALLVASMALADVGGFEVASARGGREAIECAKSENPDVILMDLVMDDLDGPDVLRLLRGCKETERMPIIFHTAATGPANIKNLMALGARGVIEKPCDPMILADEIRRILGLADPV